MTGKAGGSAPESPAKKSRKAEGAPGSEAERVARFLRRHPNFLAEHPDLLDHQEAPGQELGEGVVDLQQFMVNRLRQEVDGLKQTQREIVALSRDNLMTQERVHKAALTLLSANSFEELIEFLTTDLAVILDLDLASLCIERAETTPEASVSGVFPLEPETVNALIGGEKRLLLKAHTSGDPRLYGQGADLVASEALIRLDISPKTPPALLALGSRQPEFFHPGQATELLAFLGACLEQLIRLWLTLPSR